MTDQSARIAQLEAALEWYADESNYETQCKQLPYDCCVDFFEPINRDNGAKARAALATPAPDAVQEAARVLLTDPAAVMALAEAYDREDSAQRGEPDPHGALFENEPYRAEWLDERKHCAAAALRAIAGDRT